MKTKCLHTGYLSPLVSELACLAVSGSIGVYWRGLLYATVAREGWRVREDELIAQAVAEIDRTPALADLATAGPSHCGRFPANLNGLIDVDDVSPLT